MFDEDQEDILSEYLNHFSDSATQQNLLRDELMEYVESMAQESLCNENLKRIASRIFQHCAEAKRCGWISDHLTKIEPSTWTINVFFRPVTGTEWNRWEFTLEPLGFSKHILSIEESYEISRREYSADAQSGQSHPVPQRGSPPQPTTPPSERQK